MSCCKKRVLSKLSIWRWQVKNGKTERLPLEWTTWSLTYVDFVSYLVVLLMDRKRAIPPWVTLLQNSLNSYVVLYVVKYELYGANKWLALDESINHYNLYGKVLRKRFWPFWSFYTVKITIVEDSALEPRVHSLSFNPSSIYSLGPSTNFQKNIASSKAFWHNKKRKQSIFWTLHLENCISYYFVAFRNALKW